ncbi:major facilitator superfamily domain-containing protein [Trichoderma chlorosporum]
MGTPEDTISASESDDHRLSSDDTKTDHINAMEKSPEDTISPSESEKNRLSVDVADPEKQPVPVEETVPPRYSIFTLWQKRMLVLAAASTAFFSPISAQIYLPALTQLSDELHVSSAKINLTITTYMIFQGITPMFLGSLADSGGRRPAYIVCFVIYIGANIGLALAPSYGSILGLRCLQSAGSSSTVALCMAVVADVITSAERGQYVGFTSVPSILAPTLGPILGGVLSQTLGWRAIFWFLTIMAGVTLVLIAMFLPETCRHIVGDGSIYPPPLYRSGWQILTSHRNKDRKAPPPENKFKFQPPNILGSLLMLTEKGTGLLLATSSLIFAGFYCIASAMPTLFKNSYGYDEITVGLMYLPLALGSVLASMIVGRGINWNYKRHCQKLGIPLDRGRQQDLSNFPIERVRLEVGLPLLFIAGLAFIGWGWAMNYVVHVSVPCIISCLIGMGMIGFNNTSSTLLVDIHPGKAGTATAANNFTRCLVGAGASAAIVPLINAIGVGWSFTIIGFIYFACSLPMVYIMVKGIAWRAEKKAKEEQKQKKKNEASQ